jgi:hypothetical protein
MLRHHQVRRRPILLKSADQRIASFAMATTRPDSNTLPRNFTFLPGDRDLPRTPHNQPEPPQGPPPRFILRRSKRNAAAAATAEESLEPAQVSSAGPVHDPDVPLPTIEVSENDVSQSDVTDSDITVKPRFSPPKTPEAQLIGNEEQLMEASRAWETDWQVQQQGARNPMNSRPSTGYSGMTYSSFVSTVDTTATSPDLIPVDGSEVGKLHPLSSPLAAKGNTTQDEAGTMLNPTWTKEMDVHLWYTYMKYLEDPTHTPFKMLPGTTPPTGVCERVAREARRTYKAANPAKGYQARHWSKDAPDLNASATPEPRTAKPQWPRSDGAVRRRLKVLSRRQPTLAAHYARLVYRTPSPGASSSSQQASSPPPAPNRNMSASAREAVHGYVNREPPASANVNMQDAIDQNFTSKESSAKVPVSSEDVPDRSPRDTAFSTREMNLSLATSTSSTMHPDGFFSQLAANPVTPQPIRRASDDVTTPVHKNSPLRDVPQRSESVAEVAPGTAATTESWLHGSSPFGRLPDLGNANASSAAHGKSQSLHHNFFGRGALFGSNGTLASPFAPNVSMPRAETVRETKRSTLDSPIQFAQPVPKRRKEHNPILNMHLADNYPRMRLENDPFSGLARKTSEPDAHSIEAMRPRLRVRGATVVGAYGHGIRKSKIPPRPSVFGIVPPKFNLTKEEEPEIVSGVGLAPPFASIPPRLASPFMPEMHANTYPRNHVDNATSDIVMTDAPSTPPPSRREPVRAPARGGLQGLFAEWRAPPPR